MSTRALFRYVQAWHSHRACAEEDEDDDVEGAAVTLGGERCRLWRELLFLF